MVWNNIVMQGLDIPRKTTLPNGRQQVINLTKLKSKENILKEEEEMVVAVKIQQYFTNCTLNTIT